MRDRDMSVRGVRRLSLLSGVAMRLHRSLLLLLSVAYCRADPATPSFNPNNFFVGASNHVEIHQGTQAQCDLGSIADRFDCYPEPGASQKGCESRGCCWRPLASSEQAPNVPYCYYPSDYQGYMLRELGHYPDHIKVELQRQTPSGIDVDVQSVTVNIYFYENDTARIMIVDPTRGRFVPPVPEIPQRFYTGSLLYNVSITNEGHLTVYRLDSSSTKIFHTDLSRLVFTDQFLQLSTLLPTDIVFGLGEQWTRLRRSVNWTSHVFFNRDRTPMANENLYGSHPFLLGVDKNQQGYGIFLHNSNAKEVVLQPTPAATFRALGGVLDFFVFVGPTISDVVKQLQHVVGKPAMPPFWGLGFHLCRFGYKSLNRTRYIMEMNIKAGVPLDTQWNDIDYMERSNDFTYDKERFQGLPEFVQELHDSGRHYVVIVDPAVSGSEAPGSYPPYDDGLAMDVFVKNVTGGIVYGKVWNDKSSVFPDFSHPNASDYWYKQFSRFHDVVPFDGAWIDMNEPSNFYDGHKDGCPMDQKEERPPYVPAGEKMCSKTLCMSDRHFISSHYNVHNIYSQLEAQSTYNALATIRNKRPFIISRATSPGQGTWSGHWSGDIRSSWEDLRLSIPNMLSIGMYGIPLIGADICGFNGNTTVELCARWHALGAFYPFSRNHNTDDGIDQDPFSMGPIVIQHAVANLEARYLFLPYLYTLFYRSHVYGDTVARPLFFEFPDDPKTYDIDEQFMWGPALLVNPALYQGQTDVTAYVPAGIWVSPSLVRRIHVQNGTQITFPAALNGTAPVTPLLFRGGHIVPVAAATAQVTSEIQKKPIALYANLDETGKAFGELFWDDGNSLATIEEKKYNLYKFLSNWDEKVVVSVSVVMNGFSEKPLMGQVLVSGVTRPPNNITIGTRRIQFVYNSESQFLILLGIGQRLDRDFVINWS